MATSFSKVRLFRCFRCGRTMGQIREPQGKPADPRISGGTKSRRLETALDFRLARRRRVRPRRVALPFPRSGGPETRFADNGLVSKVRLSRNTGVRNVWKVAIPALLLFRDDRLRDVASISRAADHGCRAERSPLRRPPRWRSGASGPGDSRYFGATARWFRFVWPSNWVNAWIPLESWGKLNGFGPLAANQRQSHATLPMAHQHGVVGGESGEPDRLLRGLACWLGFPPQLINGLP